MPPNQIQEAEKKKGSIKKIILVSFLALLLLVASFAVPMMLKQTLPIPVGDKATTLLPKVQKIYTQEEKAKILEDLTKSIPMDSVSVADRTRTLKKLSTKTLSATTTTSVEDRLRILQALEASSGR